MVVEDAIALCSWYYLEGQVPKVELDTLLPFEKRSCISHEDNFRAQTSCVFDLRISIGGC